jgi:sulfite exporter TauE/SafE
MLDLRLPMGLMFSLVGAMLAVYGAIFQKSSLSQNINVNFVWGLVLLVFGLAMLGLARWAAAAEKNSEGKQ